MATHELDYIEFETFPQLRYPVQKCRYSIFAIAEYARQNVDALSKYSHLRKLPHTQNQQKHLRKREYIAYDLSIACSN